MPKSTYLYTQKYPEKTEFLNYLVYFHVFLAINTLLEINNFIYNWKSTTLQIILNTSLFYWLIDNHLISQHRLSQRMGKNCKLNYSKKSNSLSKQIYISIIGSNNSQIFMLKQNTQKMLNISYQNQSYLTTPLKFKLNKCPIIRVKLSTLVRNISCEFVVLDFQQSIRVQNFRRLVYQYGYKPRSTRKNNTYYM
eukprot:TRINITY_DN12779_c0_g2_i1.p1 TRINITY_DN12779_c0_g2~~TRINITY_DN12779_c0_g2_i1.p1  ORF type:complete len:211 (-),score=-10.74 TRINITY_DN12779_c0_g2_i1:293-874(-)